MEEKWLNGSYIESETEYEELEAQDEHLIFSWFKVNSNLQESPAEQTEKKKAILEQIQNGVIQTNGMPVGYAPPAKKQNKFARKRRREMERQAKKQQRQQQQRNQPFRR